MTTFNKHREFLGIISIALALSTIAYADNLTLPPEIIEGLTRHLEKPPEVKPVQKHPLAKSKPLEVPQPKPKPKQKEKPYSIHDDDGW